MNEPWRTTIDTLPGRITRLVAFLKTRGYRFASPSDVMPGPDREVETHLTRLTELIGPVPAALAHFYRVIGSLDLRGEHSDWQGCALSDPLVIEPISGAVQEAEEYTELEDPAEEYWAPESGIFRAPIAPDAYHKAGLSGGMWLGVEIPNEQEDPLVLEAVHQMPLTLYIERVLASGGFLGLEGIEGHTWPIEELKSAAMRRRPLGQ